MNINIRFSLSLLLVAFLLGCDTNTVQRPAYLSVDELKLASDPTASFGNSSSKITSAWVSVSGTNLGAFELPMNIPVIIDSNDTYDIRIEPGIDINGISSFRGIYPFYKPLDIQLALKQGDVTNFPQGSKKIVEYDFNSNLGELVVLNLEDFEDVGRNLIPTDQSDTSWILTSNPDLKFTAPPGEGNIYSGMAILDTGISKFEVSSIENFILPRGGKDVYIEFDYWTTNPLTFGVIAANPGQIIQMPTATFSSNEKWNHGYINLLTEVSGSPLASSFKIFMGSAKLNNGKLDTVLVDNIRLIYRQ